MTSYHILFIRSHENIRISEPYQTREAAEADLPSYDLRSSMHFEDSVYTRVVYGEVLPDGRFRCLHNGK